MNITQKIRGIFPSGKPRLPDEVVQQLGQELDPTLLKLRLLPDSTEVLYLDGATVVNQANAIFGFGGWSFELLEGPRREDVYTVAPGTGDKRYLGCFYWASGKMTLLATGAVQENVSCIIPAEDTLEAHAVAFAGCVTQTFKRCASRHGTQFGNELRPNHFPPSEPVKAPENRTEEKIPKPARVDVALSVKTPEKEAVVRLRTKATELAFSLGWSRETLDDWISRQTGKRPEALIVEEWTQKVLNPLLEKKRSG